MTEKSNKITIFRTPSWGILGTAFLIMLAAKCFGFSNISWWIVTAPLWMPWAICIAFFLSYAFVGLLCIGVYILAMTVVETSKFAFRRISNLFRKRKE